MCTTHGAYFTPVYFFLGMFSGTCPAIVLDCSWICVISCCRCVGSPIEREITFGGFARMIIAWPSIRVSGSRVLIVYNFPVFVLGSSTTPGCRLIPFGWRPALTRIYCRTCKRVHNPKELTNNRTCNFGPLPRWQKRREIISVPYVIL